MAKKEKFPFLPVVFGVLLVWAFSKQTKAATPQTLPPGGEYFYPIEAEILGRIKNGARPGDYVVPADYGDQAELVRLMRLTDRYGSSHYKNRIIPRPGTIIPRELLGADNEKIPGAPNFSWGEGVQKYDGSVPPLWRLNQWRGALALQQLRNALGKAVRVSTQWRALGWALKNDSSGVKRARFESEGIGGFHPPALAWDLRVSGMNSVQIAEAIEALIKAGKMPEGGVGRYYKDRAHTTPDLNSHYDPSGHPAYYGGSKSSRRRRRWSHPK